MNNLFNLAVQSRTDNLGIIREFVTDIAKKSGFNEDAIGDIEIAVDEACANVIKHAYRNDDSKTIEITVETNGRKLTILIRDSGPGFNPATLETPQERLQKHARGGLGIALIKRVMDEVTFDMNPGIKNQVRMVKYIS